MKVFDLEKHAAKRLRWLTGALSDDKAHPRLHWVYNLAGESGRAQATDGYEIRLTSPPLLEPAYRPRGTVKASGGATILDLLPEGPLNPPVIKSNKNAVPPFPLAVVDIDRKRLISLLQGLEGRYVTLALNGPEQPVEIVGTVGEHPAYGAIMPMQVGRREEIPGGHLVTLRPAAWQPAEETEEEGEGHD